MSQETPQPSSGGSPHQGPELRVKPAAMTALLHEEIPLTRAMGMTVAAWDGRSVKLTAPLKLNHNHADTAFGGAISSMGIMAGYCLVHMLLEERQISNRLLIQKSSVDYLRPIDADLEAVACVPEEPVLGEFLQSLQKRRRGRLTLESRVMCQGLVAAVHSGLYVAMLY